MSMEENVAEKILSLINARKISDLRQYIENINNADFPSIFEELEEEKIIIIYRLLSKEKAANVFVELDSDSQQKLISSLTDKEIKNVMNEIYMDDAADLIEEMPANVVNRILRNTNPENRQIINELLKYPKDTAGTMMTTEFVYLHEDTKVSEAFDIIKERGLKKETVYNSYILKKDRTLLGVVDIKDLLIAEKEELVKDIMDTNIIKVYTLEDQEEVTKIFNKYDCLAVPVVDKEDRLVGIITIDDAVDIMQEETLEDFEKMAAITPSEDEYFKTSVFTHAKNRIPWLLLLMLSSMITGGILENFEAAISSLPLLVAFIPLLMDTGGNCGAQTSTLIIRGLATDEIRPKDILKALWKETRVSIYVGLTLAFANTLRIMIQYNSNPNAINMAISVNVALVGTVLSAKLLGCLLPILAKKVKLDPAIMAAPIITTIVDVLSVVMYFNIIQLIFNI